MAEDVAGNSDEDVSNWDFSISGAGNNDPVIDTSLHCKYPQEECNECIKYGESFWLEIEAHDPDGDSIYYEWYAMWGRFPNGQHTMTTAENYVVYTAPTKAKAESSAQGGEGEEKLWQDWLKATVVDVRGGSNFITGYLGLYDPGTSCLCGDVNDDGNLTAGDVVFLVTYLYAEGPPPDPMETGDANNDCVVDIADVVYLLSYLFGGGPLPECGWICPPDLKTPNSGSHEQTAGKAY